MTQLYIHNLFQILFPHGILAIKKEIMPFAATWLDLEMIILSEVSQKETNTI